MDKKETSNLGRYEVMAEAAQRGDVQAIMKALRESPFFPTCADSMEGQTYIQTALENLARNDPVKLAETLFTSMLAFNGRLFFRAQHHIEVDLHNNDKSPNHGDLPTAVAQEWLPRLHKIEEAILQTSRGMASVMHTLRLAYGQSETPAAQPHVYSDRVVRIDTVAAEKSVKAHG